MNLFKTSDTKIVNDCQIVFDSELTSALLVKRFEIFIASCVGTAVQFCSFVISGND